MSGYTLTAIREGTSGFTTTHEVQQILQDVHFHDLVDPLNHSFSCIDGRGEKPGLATPAGDAGEFLLTLAIYNRYMSLVHQGTTNVHELFIEYLSTYHKDKPFYMHTSELAVEQLANFLNITPEDVINPQTQALKETLLEYVVKPEYMGCGHIALTIQKPDDYIVPAKITQDFVRSFFQLLWGLDERSKDLSKMELVVLKGNHEEKGILEITSEPKPQTELQPEKIKSRMFPLFTPTIVAKDGTKTQFFNHHGAAVTYLRYKNAKFLKMKLIGQFPELRIRHLKIEIDRLAEKRLFLTVGFLAPTLSLFKLVFDHSE